MILTSILLHGFTKDVPSEKSRNSKTVFLEPVFVFEQSQANVILHNHISYDFSFKEFENLNSGLLLKFMENLLHFILK